MKRVFQAVAVVAFIATVFASCSTHTSCPAYGKHGQAEPQQEYRF